MTGARRGRELVPCDHVPHVVAGDRVLLRTASGGPVEATALSEPRHDRPNAIGPFCYLTVSVNLPLWDHPVNWPAEAVEPIAEVSL